MPNRVINTTDSYSPDNTVETGAPVSRMTLTVLNNPIFAQFKVYSNPALNTNSADYEITEREMIPGVWGWSEEDFNGAKILGVRIRSENSGQSARVTINA